MRIFCFFITVLILMGTGPATGKESTNVYFGDTHVHTSYSFDAYLLGNQSADPDTAYRYAKGLPVIHPYHRGRMQIGTPLDFLVVADHAELLGVMRAFDNGTTEMEKLGFLGTLKRKLVMRQLNKAMDDPKAGAKFFDKIRSKAMLNHGGNPLEDPNHVPASERANPFGDTTKIRSTAWQEIIESAEHHNDPGKFTTFIGWEWSSGPVGVTLHRVVFTPDGADTARQFLPFGSDQGMDPEDLWQWLSETEDRVGARFVAIPHNSNISKGYMFAETTLKGKPITADYARTRLNWEPVVEMTQNKGDSETHPQFSPDDEFSDFETYEFYGESNANRLNYKPREGDFIRPALKRGLAIEEKVGVNPFKFGLIGSTDTHTGLSSVEEDNFSSKIPAFSRPEYMRLKPHDENRVNGWYMSASGLAAAWAKENTREEIYAAFKRKEVYATTGPRIKVRFFAGWDFSAEDIDSEQFAAIGYEKGVPMGGDLTSSKSKTIPQFLIRAVKEPNGANLDRIQVIKGWIDEKGRQRERVFDVAWSKDRELDTKRKLPAVENTVALAVPDYDNSIGAPELSTLWVDPTFDPDQRAFYYARVLQIPTPRHSVYDAVALQMSSPPEEGPATIQDRAYTSPIWYTP